MNDVTQNTADGDPGFGVYVHWPFCAQKCPYCDFNSHVRPGGWDEAAFLDAYRREIRYVADLIGPQRVQTIFFGGGTPSLMQPSTTAAILDEIAQHWSVDDDAEITLEANPGSVEADRFCGFRSAGVNRVSLGVQSLRPADLRALGRIHTVEEALAAVEIATGVFDRASFDLIYARPGQTVEAWREELSKALLIAADIGHVSLYQLTIEPDTPFARWHAAGRLIVPSHDVASDLFAVTQELTDAAGLAAYETSNHAKPGEESRHNLVYWRYGAYAGIGPGAHGRLLVGGERMTTVTERQPEDWAQRVRDKGHGFTEQGSLLPGEAADEMLLIGLRLVEGVDLQRLADIGGVRPADAVVDGLTADGLVERFPDANGRERLRAIGDGRFLLNRVVYELSSSFEAVGANAACQSQATAPSA